MGQSLKKYIKNCRQCVLGKSHTGRRPGLWQRGERPSSALDVWHIDHAGPLVKSHGCTQLLVVIDAFSKYCSLRPIRKKNTEDTIRALSLVFEQMGKPRRIIADRTAAFASLTVQNFLADQEVQLHHIATGMPRGNGQVEHTRTVFNLVRVSLTAENEKNWVHEISAIENNINATVHGTTGYPPNALHFATNPRLKATQQFLSGIPENDTVPDFDNTTLTARQRMSQIADAASRRFNVKRYKPVLFALGDQVAVEDSQHASGGKLRAKYNGPFVIKQILPSERYLLAKKGQKTTVAAHQQLRQWQWPRKIVAIS
jgi:hypothetical protein